MTTTMEMVVQCCVCGRVRSGNGRYSVRKSIPEIPVSHTYCPPCARKALAEIQARYAEPSPLR